MRFISIKLLHCALAIVPLQASLNAVESGIKLTGPKDLVLGIETRQMVLAVGANHLSTEQEDYQAKIEALATPFAFKDSTPATNALQNNTGVEEAAEPAPVVYDDAAVLALSAASFAKKVRGSIARGESSFLQLEGGTMLRPGTSFPVRLPQAKDQTFMLTITEITSDGYTLQIGEATKQLSFDNKSQSNSIQFSQP